MKKINHLCVLCASNERSEWAVKKNKMTEKKAHITVNNLTMAYGSFVVMRDLTFSINHGDIFIIMGGSGCGKSTLLKIMIGLKTPATGQVFYGDTSFWEADPVTQDQLMQRFGILYQSGALWSSMTLAENVALPLQQYTNSSP
jgi:phospholipid/cholesterol/gamma-HCH transport system ATP-binding protein